MAKHLRMGNYGSGYYAYNPIGGVMAKHLRMGNYGSGYYAYNPIGGYGQTPRNGQLWISFWGI